MTSSRPNTHLETELFRPHMILCAGEDPIEFIDAFTSVSHIQPKLMLEYRCYRFWHAGDLLLAWSGIGTGCIEPFMHEYFQLGDPARVALLGTAGLVDGSGLSLGQGYCISNAYNRQNAINALGTSPEHSYSPQTDTLLLESASIVSTDLYYGLDSSLSLENAQLVDMETAQFYWLCSKQTKAFEYLSFKGPANRLGFPEDQDRWTPEVLRACSSAAIEWTLRP